MWFRNFRVYRLAQGWDLPADDLDGRLARDRFGTCAPGQLETLGWVPPLEVPAPDGSEAPDGEDDAAGAAPFVWTQGDHLLLRARHQERILPASAVREVLEERLAEAEAKKGAPLRGAEKRELAEDVRAELLPRALLRSQRSWLLIDARRGLVLTETASASRAEALLSQLRGAVGSLAVVPATFSRPVTDSLTAWLRAGGGPDAATLGAWCDLEDPQDTANKVRFRGQDLAADEVRTALERGLAVTALELEWDTGAGVVSFVLDGEGTLRRVRFPDLDDDGGLAEDATTGSEGDAAAGGDAGAARLDAELALLGPTLGALFDGLHPALGGLAEA